jgi:hypothetical protein
MKTVWLFAAILLGPTLMDSAAMAFSTDQSANQNSNGSPKFVDPDDQKPGFMTAPSDSNDHNLSFFLSGTNTTVPMAGENDNGAKAFDRALAH